MADDKQIDTETSQQDSDNAPKQRFFELVPWGTQIQFVNNRTLLGKATAELRSAAGLF